MARDAREPAEALARDDDLEVRLRARARRVKVTLVDDGERVGSERGAEVLLDAIVSVHGVRSLQRPGPASSARLMSEGARRVHGPETPQVEGFDRAKSRGPERLKH
jgi:hypothetical protein